LCFAESYYLGTPVIADYRSGAVKEIIDNNYIVNYDNDEETFNKILFIKNNRDNIHVSLGEKFKLEYNINLWYDIINNLDTKK
jgi:glycosyltransferase involved in cell wall biosynthesis